MAYASRASQRESPVPMQSPAPIYQSRQKRKRRPTRTPKSTVQSHFGRTPLHLCSPSPFLDRSFQRKKLLFDESPSQSDDEKSLQSDKPNHSETDSEYDVNQDFDDTEEEYDEYEYEYQEEYKKKQMLIKSIRKRATTNDLVNDIENLSIRSNTNKLANNSLFLRNSRASIKLNKNNLQTPQLFKNQNQSKKTAKKTLIPDSNKKKYKQTSANQAETHKKKQTTVRVTKSNRVFKKHHTFGKLLVEPLQCGSGCPLYCSAWKGGVATVTKLMPLFENEEFSAAENVDNACREYELHLDTYRKGCKIYGVVCCPIVAIYACVTLKHTDNKKYLSFVMPALHCNLAQFASKYRKLSNEEAHRLLLCGLHFLAILRDTNMIHNDIKPENIFVDVSFDDNANVKINKFVFGDFGCAALTNEEFPFGNLTGTVTMWDLQALGAKHGDEDGFHFANDLYGFIGSLLDAMYGGSIMEELLEEEDEDWEATEWSEYTDLIRVCRAKMTNVQFMETELNDMECRDPVLRTVLMQIGRTRNERLNLDQILLLVDR